LQNCQSCGYKKWLKTGKRQKDGRRLYKCGNPLCGHEEPEDFPFERPRPQILYLDVEASLTELYGSFGLKVRGEYLNPKLVEHPFYIICWSAMWMGENKIISGCVSPENALIWRDKEIITPLVELMDRADIVAGHGMDAFDVKVINTRILLNDLSQPDDYKTIDTLKIARKKFMLESNTLDYILHVLGLRPKDDMKIEDWIAITQGDKKTLKKMLRYNRNDVRQGAKVLDALKGWDKKYYDYGLRTIKKLPIWYNGSNQ
jgi:hypothetical protein